MKMASYAISAFFAALFFLHGASSAAESPWERKLPFKTAIIQYDVGGNETGSETHYMRAYGQETAHIRKTKGKVMFMNTSTDKQTITTPELVTEIDLEKKTGREFVNPVKYIIEEYNKLSAKEKETVQKNAIEMGTSFQQMGMATIEKKAGSHLGHTCDVVKSMGMTSLVTSDAGIMMKMEGGMMGISVSMVATKFDKDVSIPSDPFTIPSGVKVEHDKEADKSNREAAKMVIDMLKDPNASKKMKKDMEGASAERDKAMKQANEEMKKAEKERATQRRREESEAPAKSEEPSGNGQDNAAEEAIKKGLGAIKKLF